MVLFGFAAYTIAWDTLVPMASGTVNALVVPVLAIVLMCVVGRWQRNQAVRPHTSNGWLWPWIGLTVVLNGFLGPRLFGDRPLVWLACGVVTAVPVLIEAVRVLRRCGDPSAAPARRADPHPGVMPSCRQTPAHLAGDHRTGQGGVRGALRDTARDRNRRDPGYRGTYRILSG